MSQPSNTGTTPTGVPGLRRRPPQLDVLLVGRRPRALRRGQHGGVLLLRGGRGAVRVAGGGPRDVDRLPATPWSSSTATAPSTAPATRTAMRTRRRCARARRASRRSSCDFGVDLWINGHEAAWAKGREEEAAAGQRHIVDAALALIPCLPRCSCFCSTNYERNWAVFQSKLVTGGSGGFPDVVSNPGAPIYIVSGCAGDQERHEPFVRSQPAYSAFRSNTYGYRASPSTTHRTLLWEQVLTDNEYNNSGSGHRCDAAAAESARPV